MPSHPATQAELLELIELQSDRLARLVTNLLDMTRIESGALEVRTSLTAFDELVAEALLVDRGTGRRRSGGRGRADPICPCCRSTTCWSDRCWPTCWRMRRASSPRAARSASALAVVVDRRGVGGGLRQPTRVRASPPGSESRSSRCSARTAGVGEPDSGLAIAKAFVEAHGGSIWIDPDVTAGARFVFTLPVAAPACRPMCSQERHDDAGFWSSMTTLHWSRHCASG